MAFSPRQPFADMFTAASDIKTSALVRKAQNLIYFNIESSSLDVYILCEVNCYFIIEY
jgi:hypothetical protein